MTHDKLHPIVVPWSSRAISWVQPEEGHGYSCFHTLMTLRAMDGLTNATNAMPNTAGLSWYPFLMTQACDETAPSNAKNRNMSSKCGKWKHADRKCSRPATTGGDKQASLRQGPEPHHPSSSSLSDPPTKGLQLKGGCVAGTPPRIDGSSSGDVLSVVLPPLNRVHSSLVGSALRRAVFRSRLAHSYRLSGRFMNDRRVDASRGWGVVLATTDYNRSW